MKESSTGFFDALTTGNPATPAARPSPANPESAADPEPPDQPAGTALQIKEATQELLRLGVLEALRKPNLYRIAITRQQEIQRVLEPLDLDMRIDDVRGLAYLTVSMQFTGQEGGEEDEWAHPLVRRQRLTLEQSLLVALLRQYYMIHEQEAGVGAGEARVALEDLLPHLQLYLGELGSDSREQQRLRLLLEKLKPHGIVSEIDPQDQITIRPIIVHLANPENLLALLETFKRAANPASLPGCSADADETDAANDVEEGP